MCPAHIANSLRIQAILSCSITIPAPNPALVIRFRKGNILVAPPIYRPKSLIVQYFDKPGSDVIVKEETRDFTFEGGGWHFQGTFIAQSKVLKYNSLSLCSRRSCSLHSRREVAKRGVES